ncbi:Chromosome segregation ATPase [Rubrobacter radiotolerans]|uniref:Chromosome segregation ATPase n=1 Tax=Rubrobacter radiotolerans TaxID=42256 RepID=A0A023X3P8_RUBRA|nr:Chromosome segregation ATPase [Rubrobacter radiotolerans]SMC05141.1 condensin subunit Smc [Rubrobacter radiotolerans DSM 5868]
MRAVYIKGFKTFARPVRMPLEGGVTAVVGPNGSGKSNITDAVLFALGEGSPALLRAGTLGDLIFSGSESLGATNVAEVTLVLDNRGGEVSLPYEEVSLSRRISREGRTEYRINGARARLQDVRSVAGEAGLGRHSILRQGAVDAIVSGGAEACRQAVEEAAGLGVYRRRRVAAARRLEKADEQLERSRSIEAELAEQLRRIESEAAAAREYRRVEARYRSLSLAWLHGRIRRGTGGVEERIVAEKERLAGLAEEVEAVGREEASLAGELKRSEGQMLAVERVVESLEEVGERLRACSMAAERNVLKLESRGSDRESRDRLVRRLDEERVRVAREVGRLRERYAGAEAEHERAEAERIEAGRAAGEASKRGDLAERSRNEAASRLDRFAARLAALDSVRETRPLSRETLAAVAGAVRRLEEADVVESGASDEVKGAVAKLRSHLSELDAGINRRRGVLASAEGRIAARVKSLRAPLPADTGPRLYEVVRARPGYEFAVEAALSEYGGGVLAAGVAEGVRIVSENERVAVRLDASGVEGDHAPPEGKPLLECVEVLDERYRGAVERLLGGTFVVEDAGASELTNGHVAVTRAGLRLTRTSVSLVKAGRFTGEARLAAAVAFLRELESGPAALLAEVGTRLGRTSRELQGLERRVREVVELGGRAGRVRERLVKEASRRHRALVAGLEESARRENEVAGLRREVEAAELELREAEREAEEARRARSGAVRRRDAAEVRAGRTGRTLRGLRRALTEGARRVDGISSRLERASTVSASDREETDRLATRIVEVAKTISDEVSRRQKRVRLGRAELGETYRRLSGRQNELARRAAEVRSKETAARERIESLEAERERARRAVSEAEAEVREEWAATPEDAAREAEAVREELGAEGSDGSDARYEERLEKERAKLARRLKRFGDVNLLALTQEAEVRERHDTIRDQRTDAEAAAEEIRQIIATVDREIENRFSRTFERVRTTFAETVPRMLSGGSGSLELSEAGVEISVRLGRKGWRSLKVLSGGERSLLALSFLFSILLSRGEGKRTFCILDEAEAALDDVNLARFLAVVDSQRENGQFILVTHQKRTMAAADVLYGVVQDASGATSVVSKRIQGEHEPSNGKILA